MHRYIVLLLLLLNTTSAFSQQEAYNDELKFKIIDNLNVLKASGSIQALIVNFKGSNTKKFCKTLRNNPQLKEVQLYNPTQKALNCLSEISGDSITHLFIVGCDTTLTIPSFPQLELLSIKADDLITLDMSSANLDSLGLLHIESEKLCNWKSKTAYPKLGLIDLNAPALSEFPIHELQAIRQLSIYCSLNQFPSFLCECAALELISFKNYKVIEVDPCFEQKIFDGFYSNLTIVDGKDGPVILEWLSKDHQ